MIPQDPLASGESSENDGCDDGRPVLRLIEGGRAGEAPRRGSRARAGLTPPDDPGANAAQRRPRRRPETEPGDDELADAALLLLTTVRGAEDAQRVAARLAEQIPPERLAPALEALAARVRLLDQAARKRPLPV